MSYFKAKMRQIRLRLRPRLCWRILQRSPRFPRIEGVYFWGKETRMEERRGRIGVEVEFNAAPDII